ncbi:MAG: UDP-N-acetylmuramate dehydrogenase [Clostridiales bacterium]|nr:UDP-N-acetylmuramate dehydrogenase [Clostridiales bacterium]
MNMPDWKRMNQEFINELNAVIGKENIRLEEPMAKHTTFQIGGPAQVFVTPKTVKEIQQIVRICNAKEVPFFVLGNGSNLLVSDQGMDGVVIQLYRNFSDFQIEGNIVTAQAGTMLAAIGNAAREASLTGFEFASGIPGTLGGAVMMNAGAYGGEMKDIIKTVQLMDLEGNVLEKTCAEMDFGYRHSIIEDEQFIVLGAVLELTEGNREAISLRMKELSEARREKQPLEFPSAGSTFKRPEGYFAGKLIMEANLCGYRVGGAQISEKHCGFVVNRGGATAEDVLNLIRDVQDKVYETFQVKLEPEVKLVGRQ